MTKSNEPKFEEPVVDETVPPHDPPADDAHYAVYDLTYLRFTGPVFDTKAQAKAYADEYLKGGNVEVRTV